MNAMPITSIFDLRLPPENLDKGYEVVRSTLVPTRAFPGCEGIEVLVDEDDPAHLIILERWASADDDAAYHAWRRTPEGASDLKHFMDPASRLTRVRRTTDL
jgi:quinol monooxygenase YgiN